MSAPRRFAGYALVGLGLCLIALVPVLTFLYFNRPTPPSIQPTGNNVRLRIPATAHGYTLRVAQTPADRERGLSSAPSMPSDEGMLFVYGTSAERCIWMKDMRFPLDILWLGQGKNVTHIEQGVNPDTYPQTYCFDAAYVIELNAGQAAASGIKPGQTLSF